MLSNRKAMEGVKGQLETAEANDELKATQADLESALIACDTGILKKTNKNKDDALVELTTSIGELINETKELASTAKNSPEDLGVAMKKCSATMAKFVANAIAVAAALDDKNLQKAILNALSAVTKEVVGLMQICKAVAASPEDPNLNKLLQGASKAVAEALQKLTEASKAIVPSQITDFVNKSSADIEDLATKELKGAADAIERCVAKLNQATEAAKQRAAEKGIDIEEQNVTGAILDAAQAIAKATAILMHAASGVQQNLQKLVKEPKTANVYKRDSTWAEGLISAAKTVAGAVQHLVKAANDAAMGNATEESLIVAAQAVSASTTQLVTASTVKADPNSETQRKLREASGRVAQATNQLVTAAKTAAEWEEEKMAQSDENGTNAEDKIKKMEQHMEVLRLEQEIAKRRHELGSMRKKEYDQNVNKDFKPGGTEAAAPAPQGRGRVNWNTNPSKTKQ